MCGAALPGLSVTPQYMAGRDRLTPGDKTKTPPAAATGGVLSKKDHPFFRRKKVRKNHTARYRVMAAPAEDPT